jgi:hypothetical protein
MSDALAMHPTPPATSQSTTTPQEAPRPAVLTKADTAFDEFMGLMNDDYAPLAKSMHEAAIKLYKQVSHHWSADKHYVGLHQWDAADVAQDLLKVQSHQEPLWKKLLQDAHELRNKIEASYQNLQDAEAAMLEACAYKGSHAAWGGFATPEMETIRHYHAHKFKYSMHDAKGKYEEACGFPDGWLTRIDAIHKRVLKETEALMETTAKKEKAQHHHFL